MNCISSMIQSFNISIPRPKELYLRAKTGRKLQKEERDPCGAGPAFASYKNAKSKLKLINALMLKHATQSLP